MPFTSYHMGPGILVKSLLQGSFSLLVFAWAQILIDLQPLITILTGKGQLHGFSHTYLGASLIAVIAALTGKRLSESVMSLAKGEFSPVQIYFFDISANIKYWSAFLSAFLGTYSHILLDSIMHIYMQPFYPFTDMNPLLLYIPVSGLHKLCMYSGLLGTVLYFLIRFLLIKLNKIKINSIN